VIMLALIHFKNVDCFPSFALHFISKINVCMCTAVIFYYVLICTSSSLSNTEWVIHESANVWTKYPLRFLTSGKMAHWYVCRTGPWRGRCQRSCTCWHDQSYSGTINLQLYVA
jgi:hypothetical protein